MVTDDEDPEDSRRKIYIPLVYDFAELGEIERLLGDSEKLNAKLEEGLKAWFDAHKDDLTKLTVIYPLRVSESEGKIEYVTLTPDELYQVVAGGQKLFMRGTSFPTISSEQKSSPEPKKEDKKIGEQENQQSSSFSVKPALNGYISDGGWCRLFSGQEISPVSQTEAEIGDASPMRLNAPKSSYQTYVCSYCGCRFATTPDLNSHIQTIHKLDRERLLDALAKVENMEVD